MIRPVSLLFFVGFFTLTAVAALAEEAAQKVPEPPASALSKAAPAVPSSAANTEADLAARVALLERQVAELQRFRKEQIDITDNQSKMLRDIVTARPGPEGSQRYVPNVQAIRDDSDSRHELVDTVVQGITRTTGELRIHNDMSTGQSLLINGVDTIYIAPRSVRTITIPAGTATTKLGDESTRSWMIGAPAYVQDVIIAPAVRSSVASAGQWNYDPVTGGWWRTVQ